MNFTPVVRTAVSDEIFGRLTDEVLSGRIAPGAALPPERELAEMFAVNRHAVREALKRVHQLGLIQVRQGGTSRVLDWRRNAGLDVLSSLISSGAVPGQKVIDDVLAMRRVVAIDAVGLCASAANDAEREAVLACARDYEAAHTQSSAELIAIDLVFWEAVVDGSHNLAYRLSINTLSAGIAAMAADGSSDLSALFVEFADHDAHVRLAQAIASGDVSRAESAARRLLVTGR